MTLFAQAHITAAAHRAMCDVVVGREERGTKPANPQPINGTHREVMV
jgi:hypothetical protein